MVFGQPNVLRINPDIMEHQVLYMSVMLKQSHLYVCHCGFQSNDQEESNYGLMKQQ